MKNEPLATIQKLIKECYFEAKAVFWAGSVSECRGTSASDLDLVIIFESIATAYREAFIFDGWPIDVFVHDLASLRYFCLKLEMDDGKPALINMILQGREILEQNSVTSEAKNIAEQALKNGPDIWTKAQIDKERFLITDILDDIKFSKMRLFKKEDPELAEEWTTAFESLIQTGDSSGIESAVINILAPHGGYLWDGFRSDAPLIKGL